MLMATGACRYTLLGLETLLASLTPVMSLAPLLTAANLQGVTFLLIVAGSGHTLTDLMRVVWMADQAGVAQVALLGTAGQALFLNSVQSRRVRALPLSTPPGLLCRTVRNWMTRLPLSPVVHSAPGYPGQVLSVSERRVLVSTLRGISIPRLSILTGRSVKTLYHHRRSALEKMGLRNIRELLSCPVTGVPVAPASCARLLAAVNAPVFHSDKQWLVQKN